MSQSERAISTEIHGLDLCLQGCELKLVRLGENVIAPIALDQAEAERLRLELAKVQLWEWNQFAEVRRKAEKRYARYFRSWLVMGLAVLSAYSAYPRYWMALLIALISALMWRWVRFREDQGTRAAQEERGTFFPDWTYFRRRFDESPMVAVVGPYPPRGVG
jgi:hypothetical protein